MSAIEPEGVEDPEHHDLMVCRLLQILGPFLLQLIVLRALHRVLVHLDAAPLRFERLEQQLVEPVLFHVVLLIEPTLDSREPGEYLPGSRAFKPLAVAYAPVPGAPGIGALPPLPSSGGGLSLRAFFRVPIHGVGL